jgi:ethanolamine transporter
MNIVSTIMAVFAILGALDLIIGNKLGLGGEFERGINMLGNLTLSMLGMIVLSQLISSLLSAPLKAFSEIIPIDPSAFISCILANDMGGAQVSQEIAISEAVGYFNGLIVGSMMGATVSFTLPFVMGAVSKEQRSNVLLGLLCGICTIPVGCFVAGLVVGIAPLTILLNLLPLIILSIILAIGLLLFRNASVKIFNVFGIIIRTVVIAGLAVGILEYLLGLDILPYTTPEITLEGVEIIFNIACVMAGAFPLLYIISRLIAKPLSALGRKTGMREKSLLGFIATLATSVTTFGMMKEMDDKGALLNSAFAVSAAFTLADHLAFTLSFKSEYLVAVTVGKLISGITAVALAAFIASRKTAEPKN